MNESAKTTQSSATRLSCRITNAHTLEAKEQNSTLYSYGLSETESKRNIEEPEITLSAVSVSSIDV